MRIAIVHPRLPLQAQKELTLSGFDIREITSCDTVDPRISLHPDIQLFITDDALFTHSGLSSDFLKVIDTSPAIHVCGSSLSKIYPGDCLFNIAYTGAYALFKKSIIPEEILRYFGETNITCVDIPQGYARCSIVPITHDTIATEDNGIAKCARKAGLSVIMLTPGLIPLKGFRKGFAGGAFGLTGGRLYATGILPDEESYRTLRKECDKRSVEIVELCDDPAEDFGSILFV